jgi:hypothetical protein
MILVGKELSIDSWFDYTSNETHSSHSVSKYTRSTDKYKESVQSQNVNE